MKDQLMKDVNVQHVSITQESYIRHLFKAKEMLAMRLAVLHNLYFYNNIMEDIRDNLDNGTFAEYKAAKLEAWGCKKDK